jgi:hypothetical protein
MVLAESMLAQIDVHLAAAEKSCTCTNVYMICHNDALPRAVFAPAPQYDPDYIYKPIN